MERSPASLTDRQLLQCLARGDEEALGELYHRYGTPIFNYLLRLIHEPKIAEDLLQEVFVAVWEGAHRFRGQAKVSTWLYRIAHHRAVDWLRRQRSVVVEEIERLPGDDDPEEAALGAWQADQVRDALAQLSPDHRAVLELVFYHDLSYREVAQVVGCPVGTVKSRISHAKGYLIGVLKRMGIEPDV